MRSVASECPTASLTAPARADVAPPPPAARLGAVLRPDRPVPVPVRGGGDGAGGPGAAEEDGAPAESPDAVEPEPPDGSTGAPERPSTTTDRRGTGRARACVRTSACARVAASVASTIVRRRTSRDASACAPPGGGAAPAVAAGPAPLRSARAGGAPARAGSAEVSASDGPPPCETLPGVCGGRGAMRRVRASAAVVRRPTAATSSGSFIGTTRAAIPAGVLPGRREPSVGTGPTARRSPRDGSWSWLASSAPHHQRGGRTSSCAMSVPARAPPGRASIRRIGPGRPQPRTKRIEEAATEPTRVTGRPPAGPGRRNRAAAAVPSRVVTSVAGARASSSIGRVMASST